MKYFLLPALLLSLFTVCYSQQTADIIIKNGRVLDGTGNSWFLADVAIKGGKIFKIGKLNDFKATKTIDAKGLYVTPGFIDVHGHIEEGIIKTPTANNYIHDGVTTVITGNCGGSADNMKRFFQQIDSVHPSINVASLVGHNTIRQQVMNRDNRAPTPAEQKRMEALVDSAMKEGAAGLSTWTLLMKPSTLAKKRIYPCRFHILKSVAKATGANQT
jgi:N-acyl-D-amino-acid deacylase